MTPGSRPPTATVQVVDTSAVKARIKAEIADAIKFGRIAAQRGQAVEARWWLTYTEALFGLLTDHWSLMTLALADMDDEEGNDG